MTKNQKIKKIYSDWEREERISFKPKLICCGVEIKWRKNLSPPRETRECWNCKKLCLGQFVDNERKECVNFIPRKISAEEKYLRLMFGTK